MKQQYLKKQMHSFLLAILAVFLGLLLLFGILLFSENNKMLDIRQARLLSSQLLSSLQQTESLDQLSPIPNPYRYFIYDLSGKVIVSQNDAFQTGTTVNALDFATLKEKGDTFDFVFPVIIKNQQAATVVITYPITLLFPKTANLPWLIIGGLLLLLLTILCFQFYRFLKHDILFPVHQLHDTTNAILNGNYTEKISYDFDGEIGTLCHDFEALRDELKVSKQTEATLHEKEKLLLACISHDLKTPLSSISGYVEGIRDGIAKTPEAIQNYTNTILRKVSMLSKLIDDILEHTKTELNEFSINKQELYTQEYFTDVCSDLSLDVQKAGIEFVISEIPNVVLSIDAKRMTQVMQNLVSNAVKHTPRGGTIKVAFQLGIQQFCVSVCDNGSGISAEDIPFIFDKFYRGEKARTLNVAGSGLGLTITKYIVAQHGGSIECDSLLGEGTTMCFWLPM